MPPRRNIRNENAEALREVLAEFQQDLRNVLQQSVEAAMRTVMQAIQQPHGMRQQDEPVFDDDEEEDDDNPFARDQHEPQLQQRLPPVYEQIRDNHRWESGFKLDLPEFHGSLQPEELLDWISSDASAFGSNTLQGSSIGMVAASERTTRTSR
ncbi:hypothetical protein Bca4012_012479 [Brassica carinata]